jgi:hypothetical protein
MRPQQVPKRDPSAAHLPPTCQKLCNRNTLLALAGNAAELLEHAARPLQYPFRDRNPCAPLGGAASLQSPAHLAQARAELLLWPGTCVGRAAMPTSLCALLKDPWRAYVHTRIGSLPMASCSAAKEDIHSGPTTHGTHALQPRIHIARCTAVAVHCIVVARPSQPTVGFSGRLLALLMWGMPPPHLQPLALHHPPA